MKEGSGDEVTTKKKAKKAETAVSVCRGSHINRKPLIILAS